MVDAAAMWNSIIPFRPFSGAYPPGWDRDITRECWEIICRKVVDIIEVKGKESSWLTFRWLWKSDPVKGENWRRIADGELDFMAQTAKPQGMTKGQQDAALADGYLDRLRAKKAKEERAK
jgi:hypothetical protein